MDLKDLCVLLAEDNPGDRDLIEEYCADFPGGAPELVAVRTLGRLRSRVADRKIDVILLDLNLPDSSGLDTLDRVRETAPGIPVIVLTGLRDAEVAWEAVERGADEFLFKEEVTSRILWRSIRYAVERTRAAEQVRRREELFRALVEGISDVVKVVDTEGIVIYDSPSVERLFGFERDERVGQPYLDLIHPDDVERARADFRRVVSTPGARSEIEVRVHRKDGEWRTMEVRSRNALEERAVGGIVLTFHDVTEKRRSEEALRSAEERFRVLVEQSLVGIYMIDEDGRLAYVNPRFVEILGYPAEEAVGMRVTDLVAPGSREEVDRKIRGRLEGKLEISHYVQSLETKGGSLVEVEVHGRRVDVDGRPAILGILQDITEKKRMEREFLQAQKMEAVGRLAGGIAHDFNNLLTAIGSSAELLRQDLPPESQLRNDAEGILAAVTRAGALTRQLLVFSRKDASTARIVDVNAVVEGFEGLLRRVIGEDIRLKVALGAEEARVETDPSYLEQILMNLVVNARDAIPGGGEVRIETTSREAEARRWAPDLFDGSVEGSFVYLRVTDDGEGIPEEVLPRIFDPFFTTKGPGKGTGLGLSTVYGIVSGAGGDIDVFSEVGVGTRATVRLPLAEGKGEGRDPEVRPARGGTERILLVEDDSEVRNVVRRILERAGYDVVGAADAAAAVRRFDESGGGFDLLLTDVVMPDVYGPELADRLRRKVSDLRVLFTSGYTEEEVMERVGTLGAKVLKKPFTHEALLREVRSALEAAPGPGADSGEAP